MYKIVSIKDWIPYNEIATFKTRRKAKQYMRARRLSKKEWEIQFTHN